MCIAIYKPAGQEITRDTLEVCYEANPDGCGFSYINEDDKGIKRIKIKKTLDFDTFYNQYSRAIKVNPESPFLIHFRIKTHGPINKTNCHPFSIDEDHVFMHNGTISGLGEDVDKSDTMLFNEKVLQKLEDGWMDKKELQFLIESTIAHSKLVVMNVEGDIQIYNEEFGNWDDGIWYSNDSYLDSLQWYNQKFYQDYKKEETKSEAKHIIESSYWDECDECGLSKSRSDLEYYWDLGEFQCLCNDCANKKKKYDYLWESDAVSRDTYEAWYDIEPTTNETLAYRED